MDTYSKSNINAHERYNAGNSGSFPPDHQDADVSGPESISSTEVANCGCSADSRSRARSTPEEQTQQASTPPVQNRETQQMDVMYVGSQFGDVSEDVEERLWFAPNY